MLNYDKSIDCKSNKSEIVRLEIGMRGLAKDLELKLLKQTLEDTMKNQTVKFDEASKKVELI